MIPHDVRLRAPEFLGGGPEPAVLLRTDQRFVEGLFNDLATAPGRQRLRHQRVRAGSDATLYQPVHRAFQVALVEAYCETPGRPRLDPAKIDSAGLVVRRLGADGGLPERWTSEDGQVLGWVPFRDGPAQDEDPLFERRGGASSGNSAVDAELRMMRSTRGAHTKADEAVTVLYPVPPDICAAVGTTLLFGVVPTAEPAVRDTETPPVGLPWEPSTDTTYADEDVRDLLPAWLRRSPPPPMPPRFSGRSFRSRETGSPTGRLTLLVERLEEDGWEPFDFPDIARPRPADPIGGAEWDFLRMVWQLSFQLDIFADTPSAAALRGVLSGVQVALPGGESVDLATLVRRASDVFLLRDDGKRVTLPAAWPALDSGRRESIFESTRSRLQAQLARFTQNEGRFDGPKDRYQLRAFLRVRTEPRCPPRLVWSNAAQAYRIARWYEGGPVGAVVPLIELPTLDRGFLKGLRPNVAVRVPRSIFNFLENHGPDNFLDQDLENDTRGPVFDWICGFNISIIFIVAFMLLITFVLVLNIVFWWIFFFRICIPLPRGK